MKELFYGVWNMPKSQILIILFEIIIGIMLFPFFISLTNKKLTKKNVLSKLKKITKSNNIKIYSFLKSYTIDIILYNEVTEEQLDILKKKIKQYLTYKVNEMHYYINSENEKIVRLFMEDTFEFDI